MLAKQLFKKNIASKTIQRSMATQIDKKKTVSPLNTYEKGPVVKRKHKFDMGYPVVTDKDLQNMKADPMHKTDKHVEDILKLEPGSQERTDFFYSIAAIKQGDHSEIKKTKANIKQLIDQELEFLGFQKEVAEFDQKALVDETFKQVEERSSFFFKYDNKKVLKNKKIHNVKAPGNPHRHLSIISPHEHVHPQHYIDAKSMTEADINELYALYSYYVDLHISQVRRDVKEKCYIPPQFNQLSLHDTKHSDYNLDNKFFEFYHRWREPTRTWRSQTQEIDHEALLHQIEHDQHHGDDHDHHPDPRQLSKYEVEWTEDQKFPHVANRKGYPILAEDPAERIIGLERAQAHPSYQLQAFVQTPSMDPDPTLNFEKAETIYENKGVGEWVRMWKWIMGCTLPFWPAFFTFEIYQADGVPSLDWLSDMGSWHAPLKQFQDMGNWNLYDMRYCDEHDYMNMPYALKRLFLRPSHTMYQFALLTCLLNLHFNYATKVVYNKDRDLVFVYKPEGIWRDKEYVYEVHHLESMVPAPVGAYQHIGVGHKDGITTLICMDTKEGIKLYNDPKYWNLELRDEFLSQTRSMWIDLCNKYEGRVVQLSGGTDEKMHEAIKTINRELKESVKKHGTAAPCGTYPEKFNDDLIDRRRKIAESATS